METQEMISCNKNARNKMWAETFWSTQLSARRHELFSWLTKSNLTKKSIYFGYRSKLY